MISCCRKWRKAPVCRRFGDGTACEDLWNPELALGSSILERAEVVGLFWMLPESAGLMTAISA